MSKKQSKKSAPKSAPKSGKKSAPKSKAAPAKKPAPKAPAKKAATSKPAKKAPAKAAAKSAGSSANKASSSTTMRDRAIAQAQFARKIVNRYSTGFSESDVTAQPTNLPNHLLWSLGHLAATASWFNTLMAKDATHTVPSNYESLFGMDSKPVSDPGAYPSFDEVKKHFDSSFDTLIANAMKLNDEQLQTPPEQDGHGFVSDKLDCLFKLAWHEAWHLGQIVDQRRALGITVKG